MPWRQTKSLFWYVYRKAKTRFVECGSVGQGLSTLSQYFQVYFSISELELKNNINSLCFKSLINSGPLGPVCVWGGGGGGWRAHPSHSPPADGTAAELFIYFNFTAAGQLLQLKYRTVHPHSWLVSTISKVEWVHIRSEFAFQSASLARITFRPKNRHSSPFPCAWFLSADSDTKDLT